MIVCKFGGTSLADARQIDKACAILLANPRRRIMVVSAPGRRYPGDTKITDLLICLAEAAEQGEETEVFLAPVAERLSAIARDLGLEASVADSLIGTLRQRLKRADRTRRQWLDAIVAYGETSAARLVSQYLRQLGAPAVFVDPLEAGLLLKLENGHAVVQPEAYTRLAQSLQNRPEILVFPGFYGEDEEGHVLTFSRGGSDITGAVLAASLNASLYENWSDVDHVYAVNPDLVSDPCPIPELSYREMRELAYIGFTIVHPEALQPVFDRKIPIAIKNTNRPEGVGTRIVSERLHLDRLVTGIAAADHFVSVSLRRVLANHEIGILAGILTIFAEEGVSVEHVPTGIDSVSVVLREANFPLEKEVRILDRLRQEMGFSNVIVARDLSAVMLVGEGMLDSVSVISRATAALAREKISLEVLLQDYYEISILCMMSRSERLRAVPALYREFFGSCPERTQAVV